MRLFFLIALTFSLAAANAQEVVSKKDWSLPEKYKMVSINTTPLLVQLIPFNRSSPLVTGPYNVEFHRFNGNKSFHTSLGMFIASEDGFDSTDGVHFNFRIGGEKRRALSDRWAFYTGWDFYISTGNFNLLGTDSNDSIVLGLGPRWSAGYSISKHVSVSIETALVLGWDIGFATPTFVFLPPVALNLNFVLPKG